MTAPKPKPGRHRALGSAPRAAGPVKTAPLQLNAARQAILDERYAARRSAANTVSWIGFGCVLIGILLPKHSDGALMLDGLWLLCMVVAVALHPRALKRRPAARDSAPTTEELIAAEAAAAFRVEQQQAELNEGQRHLADLEARNASTAQQLVLDEPEPYAQLGQSPFRDNFVPLEQRVLRPDNPKPAPQHGNHAVPLAAAYEPNTVPAPGTTTLPPAPKLLK